MPKSAGRDSSASAIVHGHSLLERMRVRRRIKTARSRSAPRPLLRLQPSYPLVTTAANAPCGTPPTETRRRLPTATRSIVGVRGLPAYGSVIGASRRSQNVFRQCVMTPWSPQCLHRQRIPSSAVKITSRSPGHGFRFGLRRQRIGASGESRSYVMLATMLARNSASRRAGPSGGPMRPWSSRKCLRSVISMAPIIARTDHSDS